MYPRDFFDLQLEFAGQLVQKHSLDLKTVLFNNTALYTRIIGHSDDLAPQEDNEVWQNLIGVITNGDAAGLSGYFYNAYLQAERKKQEQQKSAVGIAVENPPTEAAPTQPCFHAYYRSELNAYQLHLDINDELGVLSKNRIEARRAELRSMLADIQLAKGYQEDTILYVETWLLNIEAFNRLFPKEFSANANLLQNGNKSQDNAHWGQFLTRDKQLRAEVVEKFRHKLEQEEHSDFNLYFPCPAKYAKQSVVKLIDYY